MSRIKGPVAALIGVVALLAAACVPPPPEPATGTSPNDAPRAAEAAYAQPGPYGVGVVTLSLGDRDMELWYPADPADVEGQDRDTYFVRDFVPAWVEELLDPEVNPPYVTDAVRDVPAATDGPFPLVLFSHGFAGFRLTSTALTTHLASWGFVVIAPEYLERGLASVLGETVAAPRSDLDVADDAISTAVEASATPGGPLEGVIDGSEVFPIGHSAGGGTSLRLLQRDDVHSVIPMAAGISELSLILGNAPVLPADKAITWLAARGDGIAAVADARTGFDYTPGPRRLIELDRSGHNNAFTDLCEIGDGGIAALARATGLPIPEQLLALGDDGCRRPPNAPGPEVWDEVRHFLTAELRFRSGLDLEPVGLGDAVTENFDDVLVYRHDP
ncbi:MAG: hypothetical protein H6517_01980 [Microthrixaceae bacterium]|nr:hypothetical protein [Microthrixaceae bacterium]MCB1011644.1 hypothetical protein [Microthrixaceae bacterium]MCB9386578.1 hypothetical protein [Microthrixaceae bacterium]MCO5320053.1 hypothetical protein [Microthrixaceae bacterium]